MLSPARCGSVCYLRRAAHPVSVARRIMEATSHVMLAGDGADHFAARMGFPPADLLTERAEAAWHKWRADHPGDFAELPVDRVPSVPLGPPVSTAGKSLAEPVPHQQTPAEPVPPAEKPVPQEEPPHDTVGVLAIDMAGQMAGACSTSGTPFKVPGRVGDSPIVGHGLYVDPRYGAAVASGLGELIMGVCGTFLAVEAMRRGASPADAAVEVLQRIIDNFAIREEHQAAIIVLNAAGQWSSAALRRGYRTAVRTATRNELVEPERVMLQ
jgi:N4-(beta-N-acetylglucosaminyl)-L-asparaginase